MSTEPKSDPQLAMFEDCIPKDKHDHAAVERAKSIGFPALDPILGDLIGWVQDMNWPVAEGVAQLLGTAGPAIVPHIQMILASDDETWKCSVLDDVIPLLAPKIVCDLRADLERLVRDPTQEDVGHELPEAAAAILERLNH